MAELINSPITTLRGVGRARAASYAKIGINTVSDLLMHFPRAYENRGDIKLLSQCDPSVKNAVVLTVATEPRRTMIRRGMTLLKLRAYDDSGSCEITFFNQDFLKDIFKLGESFRFWGKVERKGRLYTMSSPAYEPCIEDKTLPSLVPVYPLTQGLTQKQLFQNIESVVLPLSEAMPDFLPDKVRIENSLCTLGYAIRNIHRPDDFASLAIAKRRLVFDELFVFATGLSVCGKQMKQKGAPTCADNDISPLLKLLPYRLTAAQERAIGDIKRDMKKNEPMSRILVGDVGCGKTVCAAAAMYIAVRNGYQAALMVPTEILAYQHYADLMPIFSSLGISCELLVGAMTDSQKKAVKAKLTATEKSSRLDIVIGTQALLTDNVSFAAPGLVVTDEQHRFGVTQRALLSQKTKLSHVLVMSATPIPRSLALVMYGDLDISKIDTLPPGRQRVSTFAVDESYRERLNGFIRKQAAEGGQIYIVCPAVEEAEDADGDLGIESVGNDLFIKEEHPPLKAAVQYAQKLQSILPDVSVGFVHGKMKSREKEDVMKNFADGKIQVLVSTTVIEVGVNVPNASLMIVENAERFGLSQLHQLRGRVGRGTRKSYCILMSDSQGDSAKKRLEIMTSTYDGYAIAEKDLAMRGPGDFFSGSSEDNIRQSGGVHFRLANLCEDTGLLSSAFDAAKKICGISPNLNEFPLLKKKVGDMFSLDRNALN